MGKLNISTAKATWGPNGGAAFEVDGNSVVCPSCSIHTYMKMETHNIHMDRDGLGTNTSDSEKLLYFLACIFVSTFNSGLNCVSRIFQAAFTTSHNRHYVA